jgi:hypothetical protein
MDNDSRLMMEVPAGRRMMDFALHDRARHLMRQCLRRDAGERNAATVVLRAARKGKPLDVGSGACDDQKRKRSFPLLFHSHRSFPRFPLALDSSEQFVLQLHPTASLPISSQKIQKMEGQLKASGVASL